MLAWGAAGSQRSARRLARGRSKCRGMERSGVILRLSKAARPGASRTGGVPGPGALVEAPLPEARLNEPTGLAREPPDEKVKQTLAAAEALGVRLLLAVREPG